MRVGSKIGMKLKGICYGSWSCNNSITNHNLGVNELDCCHKLVRVEEFYGKSGPKVPCCKKI